MFACDDVLDSGWYAERVAALREVELARLETALGAIDAFTSNELHETTAHRLGLAERRTSVLSRIEELSQDPKLLWGTIGRQVAWRL